MRHSLSVPAFASMIAVPALALLAPAKPSVKIVSPKHSATVTAPLLVHLKASHIEIVPADGKEEAGKGHLHLFVDVDVTPAEAPIPKTPQILHLGSGKDTVTVTTLAPGTHRLIAVIGDGAHKQIAGAHADTITVTVK